MTTAKNNETKSIFKRLAGLSSRDALGAKVELTGGFSTSALRRDNPLPRSEWELQSSRLLHASFLTLQLDVLRYRIINQDLRPIQKSLYAPTDALPLWPNLIQTAIIFIRLPHFLSSPCEMVKKFSNAIPILACLLVLCMTAAGQKVKPVVYTTAPKVAVAKLKFGEKAVYHIYGRATFTLTAANDDDTIGGTLVYTIPDDARQKFARLSGVDLKAIPSSITKKDVIANFQSGTACPVVHLVIAPFDSEISGGTISFNRIVLDINETPEQMTQLFCAWTRQINTDRHRRGIIMAISRLITGEE